jgi:hypothetical protein
MPGTEKKKIPLHFAHNAGFFDEATRPGRFRYAACGLPIPSHHPAEGRGIDIFIFKLFGRGSLGPSIAVDSSCVDGCGGGAGFLKEILVGTVDFGGKRSYFWTRFGIFGVHLTKGFVRTRSA